MQWYFGLVENCDFSLDKKFLDIIKANYLLTYSPLMQWGLLDEENLFKAVESYFIEK
mgnify:FL=1